MSANEEQTAGKRQKWMEKCLLTIDENYFSFLFGIISEMVSEEFMNLFNMVVAENVSAFILKALTAAAFTYLCYASLQFLTFILPIKKKLDAIPRVTREDFLKTSIHMDNKEINRIMNRLLISGILSGFLVIFQFVCNNCNV